MPLAESLLFELDHEVAVTRKLLERLPDDKLGWTPHAKSFPLGALAQHVATLPRWGVLTLTQSGLDTAGTERQAPAVSRAAALAAFDAQAAAFRAALEGKTDAELMAGWTLKQGDKIIFTMPKASVLRSFVLNHLIHHRGQLSVYLRMLDVPVPSIYGPSADESPF